MDNIQEMKFKPKGDDFFKIAPSTQEITKVKSLVDYIFNIETNRGVMYSITGDWGVGKTTFLESMKEYIDDEKEAKTFFYEAWKYQDDKNIITSLLILFAKELHKNKLIKSNIDEINKLLKSIHTNLYDAENFAEDIFKILERDELDKHDLTKLSIFEKSNLLLDDLIVKLKTIFEVEKIVIFVDDIDRVIPQKAFEIIDGIRFFFRDIKDVIIVFGINSRVISKYVEKFYTVSDDEDDFHQENIFSGEEFIEKLFDGREQLSAVSFYEVMKKYEIKEMVTQDCENILKNLNHLPYRKWRLIYNSVCRAYQLNSNKKLQFLKLFEIVLQECYPRLYFHYQSILKSTTQINNLNEAFAIELIDKDIISLEKAIKVDYKNFAYLKHNTLTKDILSYFEPKKSENKSTPKIDEVKNTKEDK